MLHKQTPTARMFVNADEFIKKNIPDNMKLAATKSSRQLRVSACQGWLRNIIVHSTFGIFSSPQYIMFMFSFSCFFSICHFMMLSFSHSFRRG